jgi:predicted 2-oxoglutarate/Fe(II)-dependent dioxygenase YbiX
MPRKSRPALDQDVLVVRDFARPDEVWDLREAFGAGMAAYETGDTNFFAQTNRTGTQLTPLLADAESPIIADVSSRIIEVTRDCFAAHDIVPEWIMFSRMGVGDFHALHADAEQSTPTGWEANHTPWRTHAGLLYLTSSGEDFHGGDLVLPQVGRTIAPVAGQLVALPSGRKHQHGVTAVESGTRLCFVVWFTRDRTHSLPDSYAPIRPQTMG